MPQTPSLPSQPRPASAPAARNLAPGRAPAPAWAQAPVAWPFRAAPSLTERARVERRQRAA